MNPVRPGREQRQQVFDVAGVAGGVASNLKRACMSQQVLAENGGQLHSDKLIGQEHVRKALCACAGFRAIASCVPIQRYQRRWKDHYARILARCLNCDRGVRQHLAETALAAQFQIIDL